jgi:leader peptidase (prepilin peptidase) / N-methyltransferase
VLSDLPVLYAEHIALFTGSILVLGLVVGSFLNVVIYRLPIILEREWRDQATELLPAALVQTAVAGTDAPSRLTLSVPRSACPACRAPITAWQNIPIVSWLLLRGRCAACKTKISAR